MGRKLENQQNWSVNGVIVTVYEELSSTSAPRYRKIRTTNSNPITRSCGYDRRAELLAYAHHLRNVGPTPQQVHQVHSPTPILPNKPKVISIHKHFKVIHVLNNLPLFLFKCNA